MRVLVDTSVWVDHLRRGDEALADLLGQGLVLMHPFILGELACGSLADRAQTLALLRDLPPAVTADEDEVLAYIDRYRLHGKGIGYVDAHLLVATALSDGAQLWTRDKRLQTVAGQRGCSYPGAGAH